MAKTSEQLAAEALALAGVNPGDQPGTNTGTPPAPTPTPTPASTPPAPIIAPHSAPATPVDAEYEAFKKWKAEQAAAPVAPAAAPKPSREERLLQEYGPGYVTAVKGSEERIFKMLAWNNMGYDNTYDRDGNPTQLSTKSGWQEKVATPPEIAHHNFAK